MTKHIHLDTYCAICELQQIAHLLPKQGPIKDFIHQNILVAFLDENFDTAVKKASELFEARSFMDFSYFRTKFAEGVISESCLQQSLDHFLPKILHCEREFFYKALFDFQVINDEKTLHFLAKKHFISNTMIKKNLALITSLKKPSKNYRILRPLIIDQIGATFDHEVHQLLFRLLSSFVDQGVSLWPYLNQGANFQESVAILAKTAKFPLRPWINNRELADCLSNPPEKIIPEILAQMLDCHELYSPYLQELLLAHPGWSGMVNVIAENPQSLNKPCAIDIPQLVCVKLALEYQYIKNKSKSFKIIQLTDYTDAKNKFHRSDIPDILSATWFLSSSKKLLALDGIKLLDRYFLQQIWQQALENTFYQSSFSLLTKKTFIPFPKKTFQAVFCMDDRECSFRRILEQENEEIETFGTAGFFGVDSYFKTPDSLPQKICPPNLTPKYVIDEPSDSKKEKTRTSNLLELATFMARHGANSTLLGFFSAVTIGHLSLFRLMSSFFHPLDWRKSHQLVKENTFPSPLYERKADTPDADGLWHGYSESEMADRVYSTLLNMGLHKDFAQLICVFGHGSSSLNNPHFAAYDCGACSGRSGAINARIFAAMANRPLVRELIRKKGITIPAQTLFVGCLHDTCSDRVDYFDVDKLGESHRQLFTQFKTHAINAIKKNAKERCLKFSLVPKNISEEQAVREVVHRSKALFEPRPELGHATNAMLIVGRRCRTYRVNLERRALLQSYDPTIDKNGSLLSNVLSAAIPVCAGINLDYYFSRLDPAIYGCGSKLSHNVVSLIGVGNGLDDDLRTGLPIQMTEMHDPIRILVVIEQDEKIIENVAAANPSIKPWIYNNWIKLAALSPENNSLSLYDPLTSSWQKIVS